MKVCVRTMLVFFAMAMTGLAQTRVSNHNQSLTVNAGADKTVTLSQVATLNGSIIPKPSTLVVTAIRWSMASGPGSVVFNLPINSAANSATFSIPGTYVLSLYASTAKLHTTDNVTITVNPDVVTNPQVAKPIGLAWDPVASTDTAPVTGYNLWRFNPDGTWTKVYDGPNTTFTDATVQVGSIYSYAVRAINSVGESAASNFITVTAVAQ